MIKVAKLLGYESLSTIQYLYKYSRKHSQLNCFLYLAEPSCGPEALLPEAVVSVGRGSDKS